MSPPDQTHPRAGPGPEAAAAPLPPPAEGDRKEGGEKRPSLNVIGLVSGGKDSFFSLLHCLVNGHRVVALANLHPPPPPRPAGGPGRRPEAPPSPHTPVARGPGALDPDSSGPPAMAEEAGPGTAATGVGEGVANDDGVGGEEGSAEEEEEEEEEEEDLNSFMYQTVGHQVIPLYAAATGIPLYRGRIVGGAVQRGKDYHSEIVSKGRDGSGGGGGGEAEEEEEEEGEEDETESMLHLLSRVMAAHPEANALCAGAILSSYQRTRVESVAVRLGLAPLAYLWKWPVLPPPPAAASSGGGGGGGGGGLDDDDDGAQLLRDMEAAGLRARVVKVATAGLDESFLWEELTSARGRARLGRAMGRFGDVRVGGAVLGEGGEFETLVVDGPSVLFPRGRIVVAEAGGGRVVREGGGSAWLRITGVRVEEKEEEEEGEGQKMKRWKEELEAVRIPDLLDRRFVDVLGAISSSPSPAVSSAAGHASNNAPRTQPTTTAPSSLSPSSPFSSFAASSSSYSSLPSRLEQWCVVADPPPRSSPWPSVREEAQSAVDRIRALLAGRSLRPSNIVAVTVLLRRMANFPLVNPVYGALFASAPNPPSRVTISCGERLGQQQPPPSSSSSSPGVCRPEIVVHLTVHTDPALLPGGGRQGLHVQSRSYWAPANIGPYSQAVSVPLAGTLAAAADRGDDDGDGDDDDGGRGPAAASPAAAATARLVFVAGQIPLIPATMELPSPTSGGFLPGEASSSSFALQAALSLQHLWRIGAETGVQWWSSAVAYIPRRGAAPDEEPSTSEKAMLAARAWAGAHRWSPQRRRRGGDDGGDGEEDAGGPDLWDQKYNPAFMRYGGGGGGCGDADGVRQVPDWDVIADEDDGAPPATPCAKDNTPPPPLFLAEVEELPRQAAVEWHAHVGFAGLGPGSVRCGSSASSSSSSGGGGGPRWTAHRTAVSSGGGREVFLHTAVSVGEAATDGGKVELAVVVSRLHAALAVGDGVGAPSTSGVDPGPVRSCTDPYLLYVDTGLVLPSPQYPPGEATSGAAAVFVRCPSVIPCASLWDSRGQRVAALALYRETVAIKRAVQ